MAVGGAFAFQDAGLTVGGALEAPVSAGEAIGTATFPLPGGGTAQAVLVAVRDVAAQPTEAPATPEPTAVVTDAPAQTDAPDATAGDPPRGDGRIGAPTLLIWLLALLALACVAAALAVRRMRRKRAARRRRRRRAGTGR